MSESAHPSEEGYVEVVAAMWHQLRRDLTGYTGGGRKTRAAAIREAVDFLDDPQFDRWCELCGAKPAEARDAMRAEVPPAWRQLP